jgi:hypothetical protein
MSLLTDPECVSLLLALDRLSTANNHPRDKFTDTQPTLGLSTQRRRRPLRTPPHLLQPVLPGQPLHHRSLPRRLDKMARTRHDPESADLSGQLGRR